MKNDTFFSQKTCSRCPNTLSVRTMSWFNKDTICMDCADKEDRIKQALRDQGKNPDDYEGCGPIPIVA